MKFLKGIELDCFCVKIQLMKNVIIFAAKQFTEGTSI